MHSRRRLPLSPPVILLLLAVAAYAVYFSWLTITRYAAFEARALDMGNLDQAIWNTARGNWFHLTNQPGTVNRLSLHVEPILVPISWLYWLYDGPPALLVLQAVVVALGALPLYALARRKQLSPWAALVLAAAYLLHPSIQAANWLEFHPVTLVPTFLMAAFYFLVAGRTGWYALFAVLAASCKEEIALLVFMLGLYAALALRPGARWARLGALTMALSLLWAFTAVFFNQNASCSNITNRCGYLGDSPRCGADHPARPGDKVARHRRGATWCGAPARCLCLPTCTGSAGVGAALAGDQPADRLRACTRSANDLCADRHFMMIAAVWRHA